MAKTFTSIAQKGSYGAKKFFNQKNVKPTPKGKGTPAAEVRIEGRNKNEEG